jgi:CheY-like chemotaxis protein
MAGTRCVRVFRILAIEDSEERVASFRSWLPDGVSLTNASSAGRAIGILRRDRGSVYGGILLDHDLERKTVTQMDKSLSGTTVVESIIEHVSVDVPVLIHSMNSAGSVVMMDRLLEEGFSVTRIPMEALNKVSFLNWLEEAREAWEDFDD